MNLDEVKKPEKLYDMHEVAAFMKISYMTLYRMVKSGKIKTINRAKSGEKPIFGFRAEDIQKYYDQLSNSIKGS